MSACHKLGMIRQQLLALKNVARAHSKSVSTFSNPLVDLSSEVSEALTFENKPIVGLESTIITHGMPFPINIKTALEVEDIVRKQGAVPATVAIINGRIKIGLNKALMEELVLESSHAIKTSVRDFPYILGKGLCGGTTVSATLLLLQLTNSIHVMVTGGIGGVHRGGQDSMDVSADLVQLGKTPICVVCSGVKSILDIPRTLEFLETQGVCVGTYGSTIDFPAFYSRKSGSQSQFCVENPLDAAQVFRSIQQLRLQSGMVLAVPVPEEHAFPEYKIEKAIKDALKEADEANLRGKNVTPFILRRVAEITEGRSLQSNIALIKHNAKVGADIAMEIFKLEKRKNETPSQKNQKPRSINGPDMLGSQTSFCKPVVIGGSILDCVTMVHDQLKMDGRSHKGHISQSSGGVGRNVADALGRLGADPFLITAVGDDVAGNFITHNISHLNCAGVNVCSGHNSAHYTLVLGKSGEVLLGVGDMEIHGQITPQLVEKHKKRIRNSPLVVIDGNIPDDTIEYVLQLCQQWEVPVWFEPTDVLKANAPFKGSLWKYIEFTSPNFNELKIMSNAAGITPEGLNNETDFSDKNEVLFQAENLALALSKYIKTVIATLGHYGVLVCRRGKAESSLFSCDSSGFFRRLKDECKNPEVRHYPAPAVEPVSVSGAGDCWNAGFISAALRGKSERACVEAGFRAATLSLQRSTAVPPDLHLSLQI